MLTLILSLFRSKINIRDAIFIFNRFNITRRKYIWLLKKSGIKIHRSCRINRPFFTDNENIEIGKDVFINGGCFMMAAEGIKIGDNVLIAPNVKICTTGHDLDPVKRKNGISNGRPVIIGNNVWIGTGAIILPGVVLADNCVIGAGSVVTKSTEPNTIYVGNPATLKKRI